MSEGVDIQSVNFLGSFKFLDQCPEGVKPEYAFMGRSNVGKSSMINHLLNRKHMAHVSSTPGKTQSLNFFEINDRWRIVDLPGYGYAKVSKKERGKWEAMINNYLLKRKMLAGVFLLMDFSIPPQKIDMKMAEWLAEHRIPFYLLFTKSDKVKNSQLNKQLEVFVKAFLENWSGMPAYIVTAANKHVGRDEVLDRISEINDAFYKVA